MIKAAIQKMEANPKSLFLIDGLGAILSAFLLGVVLVKFEGIFGIPTLILYILASLPIFFAIYDFYAYSKGNHKSGNYLKGIAIMNLVYCCLSIGFGLYHKEVIKFWGWCYLICEVSIIVVLIVLEFRVARKPNFYN